MAIVNEKSTSYITVSFFDRNNAPRAPSSLSYRIDDVMTRTPIRPLTVIENPGEVVEIVLSPDDNMIVTPHLSTEQHRVTIIATYGDDDQITDSYTFLVRNLDVIQ